MGGRRTRWRRANRPLAAERVDGALGRSRAGLPTGPDSGGGLDDLAVCDRVVLTCTDVQPVSSALALDELWQQHGAPRLSEAHCSVPDEAGEVLFEESLNTAVIQARRIVVTGGHGDGRNNADLL